MSRRSLAAIILIVIVIILIIIVCRERYMQSTIVAQRGRAIIFTKRRVKDSVRISERFIRI